MTAADLIAMPILAAFVALLWVLRHQISDVLVAHARSIECNLGRRCTYEYHRGLEEGREIERLVLGLEVDTAPLTREVIQYAIEMEEQETALKAMLPPEHHGAAHAELRRLHRDTGMTHLQAYRHLAKRIALGDWPEEE